MANLWKGNAAIFGLALLSCVVGWFGHGVYEKYSADASTTTNQPVHTGTVQEGFAEPSRATRDRDCPTGVSLPSVDRSCELELEATQRQLALALDEVDECHADEIVWPDGIGDEWRSDGFESALTAALREVGVTGDVTFHCEEFPCIARLPDSSDRFAIQEALEKHYRETHGTTAEIYVKAHGTSGAWGTRALRFIAAMPPDLADEYVRERVVDRSEDLIQSINKTLTSEAKEQQHPDQ